MVQAWTILPLFVVRESMLARLTIKFNWSITTEASVKLFSKYLFFKDRDSNRGGGVLEIKDRLGVRPTYHISKARMPFEYLALDFLNLPYYYRFKSITIYCKTSTLNSEDNHQPWPTVARTREWLLYRVRLNTQINWCHEQKTLKACEGTENTHRLIKSFRLAT